MKNYKTTQRQYLAVVSAFLLLNFYVQGSRFTVRTGLQVLEWILDSRQFLGRLAFWRHRLSDFDSDIQHCPGWKHITANSLSRLQTDHPDQSDFDNEILTYEANEVHVIKGNELNINFEGLTVASIVSAP